MNELGNLVDAFERLWDNGSPPDLDAFLSGAGAVDAAQLSRLSRVDQAERWHRGDRRSAEEYLDCYPALQADDDSAVDLIYHEYLLREQRADRPSLEEFTSRFPQYARALAEQVGLHRALANASEIVGTDIPPIAETISAPQPVNPLLPSLPAQFGRYRVVELLGRGAMGNVYLAEDTELGRQVALKLPRLDRGESPEAFDRFRREARIAATFHHPNLCPVYDFGEVEGTLYLTMPCMTGRPLSAKLLAGPLSESEAAQIALKIAFAMTVAHRAGVVHRDLKPSNILMRNDDEPVVMDFGLARRDLDLDPKLTGSGALLGTLAYMAPEQLDSTADEISPASDVYSLGVILYEMLTGRPPFEGRWKQVWEQIRCEQPTPPSEHVPTLSPGLNEICLRALAKHPQERFESMDALADALAQFVVQQGAALDSRGILGSSMERRQSVAKMVPDLKPIPAKVLPSTTSTSARKRWRRVTIAVAVVALLAVALGWYAWQAANLRWAKQQLPTIEDLARAGQLFEAYDLAVRVRNYVPGNPKLTTHLFPYISTTLSVQSTPPGARVYLKRFESREEGTSPPRTFVGTTPLSDLEVARGAYVINIELEGYETFQGTWSRVVGGGIEAPIRLRSDPLHVTLTPLAEAKAGMVFVPGGDYRLVAWRRPTDALAKLDDYFIDRFEVTNHDYKAFIDAGGYDDEQFWTQPFVDQGRELPREVAMAKFTDLTGDSGPRGWSNQQYPKGKADYPVTGITWYEAAAYAAFRGKSLPTILQWEKAARNGAKFPFGSTMPWGLLERLESTNGRANFKSSGAAGAVPVGTFEFGMSPFGCYEMAGNVAEWCLNDTSEGFIVAGASWRDMGHQFGFYGTYPGFDATDFRGFRCVSNNPSGASDQGAKRINLDNEVPRYIPVPEADVKTWIAQYYDYLKEAPVARVADAHETDGWRREEIRYKGVAGDRHAYLYLPRQFKGPHQVIYFVPAGDVSQGYRTLPQSIEERYPSFVRSGRAIFSVVLTSINDGSLDFISTAEYRDVVAREIIDVRRGLDYLETRPDLDSSRIAFLQSSAGSYPLLLPAIERRFKAVILTGAGLDKWSADHVHREANPVNFVPLINAPTLFVHGRYDELSPRKTMALPLYNLLTGDKDPLSDYEGGHVPDTDFQAQVVNPWLDKTLGRPVRSDRDQR